MAVSVTEHEAAPAVGIWTFRDVLETVQEAVILVAPDDAVLYVNPAYERMFGRRPSSWGDHCVAYDRQARELMDGEAAATLRHGESWESIVETETAGGHTLPLRHRAVVVRDEDGRQRFRHFFIHDHSGQRAIAAELMRAKEVAEQANHAKTRFLAAASHDIRQPLQAMGMFVAVLANRDHDAADQKIIERIQDSLTATEQLLSSLLDISKLEAGLVVPSMSSFTLNEMLGRLRGEFESLAGVAGLAFRVVPSKWAVRSDQALLERILRNLLSNAIRYTENGAILLGCRRRGDKLRIEVWDTGSGIPRDQLKEVFREFHQLHNPSRDRRQGLGLGLAIVERLGKLLDHRIEVRSTLHKGSVFWVEVPLAEPPSKKPVQLDLSISAETGLIALVDDDPDVLESMRLLLESWGHRVVTAASCDEAVEKFAAARETPDLVIADYRLQNGTTGGQAIARLRLCVKCDVPAIIVTGDTAPERLRMAKANGHGLLHKPVQATHLKTAIDEVLIRRRRAGRPGKARRAP